LNKIEIRNNKEGQTVIAVLNIVDDESLTAPDELGLSEQTPPRQLRRRWRIQPAHLGVCAVERDGPAASPLRRTLPFVLVA
jgi:hypothetical protein